MILGKKDKQRIKAMNDLYEDLCKAIETTALGGLQRLQEDGKSQRRKLEFLEMYLKEFHGLAAHARRRWENVVHT